MFLKFETPYNLYIVKDKITSVKQHGNQLHIITTCGTIHKLSEKDYSLKDIESKLTPAVAPKNKTTARTAKSA